MRKIITLLNREEWKSYVFGARFYDFYHTWYYHALEENGEPLLFVYEEQEQYIALPLLKRKVPNSDYFDLGSAYGYTGPISNRRFGELSDTFKQNFKKAFLEFLQEGKYISVFAKLHPFNDQYLLLEVLGGLHDNGKTVSLDLTVSYEEQVRGYSRNLPREIRKLKKTGYHVKQGGSIKDIRAFSDIYHDNMKRRDALELYLFDEQYFINLLNNDEIDARLMLVYLNDEVVCGSIITFTSGIIQGHLIGTHSDHLKYSPAKLLVDTVSMLGREEGMTDYHLGGGRGFKEDSLFQWKTNFSSKQLEFKTWRYIADSAAYRDLAQPTEFNTPLATDFFPIYRNAQTSNSFIN